MRNNQELEIDGNISEKLYHNIKNYGMKILNIINPNFKIVNIKN